MTAKKPIRFAFNTHGLGDVVHCCAAMRLYIDRGYDVALQVEQNKRWVFGAAGIPIYTGPETLPLHPYYYPSDFFNLANPDHTHSKIAHFFEIGELPKLSKKEDVWRMVCETKIDATAAVSPEAMAQARKLIDGLPKPILLLHSKGSNWQQEKSIPDGTTFALITELIDAIDGSIITLDWDSRSPTLHHDRVRPAGRIPLDVFGALCMLSDLLIGIDSGPFHLAGWFPISTLYVSRKIPPVRCCLPSPNATYLVPARDRGHWAARGPEWRFAEYQGDEATVQDILIAAFDIEFFHERKAREMRAPTTASIIGTYTYRRCGHDERRLELLPDGTIGEGAAGCERTWKLSPTPAGEALIIYGDNGQDTCHLKLCADNVFRGRWLRHERMPIELIRQDVVIESPVVPPARINLMDRRLNVWSSKQAAEMFPSYDASWAHPVGTRGNGMLWLLDPAVERSDLDSCGVDHEDWILPYLTLPPHAVLLDLASFVGTVAIWAARQGVDVIAVEPMPKNRELMEKNIALNELTDVITVIPKAFGATVGKAKMSFSSYTSQFHDAGELTIDVTTLDHEFADLERLDLIKLDVEGAECEVIAGGMTTIKRLRPRLIIEVHSHMPGREGNGTILANQFAELGYTVRRIWTNTEAYYYIEATPN
jgi:FkbM family methyltransferase